MELLERFAAGEPEAFETLFRLHQKQVYAWIMRIVRDSGVAEDLTVETFWRIHRAHARFNPTGNFPGWARRIATNAALDYLRTVRRETELPENLPARAEADSAVRRETRQRVNQAFRELPAKYRLVAILALVEEEPYENIADAVGVSASVVKIRVFRAVRMLRKKLTSMGVETGART
jgi:RNA polymerase sigma-70 factor (ECF subfamily)